jgi:hypothetical protein
MQTLHRLRIDQLQLTSLGCHFVADKFRLASRFFDLPTSKHILQPTAQNLDHDNGSNSSSTSSMAQQATGGSARAVEHLY